MKNAGDLMGFNRYKIWINHGTSVIWELFMYHVVYAMKLGDFGIVDSPMKSLVDIIVDHGWLMVTLW